MKKYLKEVWGWVKKYSWLVSLISGIITLIEKFKIGSIMNYIWNSIQEILSYLNRINVIQFIFIVSFGITLYGFIRYLRDIFKRHIPEPLLKALITLLEISPDYDTREKITFKFKIRVIFRNDTQRSLNVRSVTIIDGNIPLQQGHPKELRLRTEKVKDGWKSNQWSEESNEIRVDKDQAFCTWIGLNNEITGLALLQAKVNKQFGTLVFKIDGYSEEWKIRI